MLVRGPPRIWTFSFDKVDLYPEGNPSEVSYALDANQRFEAASNEFGLLRFNLGNGEVQKRGDIGWMTRTVREQWIVRAKRALTVQRGSQRSPYEGPFTGCDHRSMDMKSIQLVNAKNI